LDTKSLLDTLRTLEVALHQPEVRSDLARLERLLHESFRESGRSGRTYTRAEVLAEFSREPQAYEVWPQDFQLQPLSEGLALLTYRSAHVKSDGALERYTNRSSLWQLTEHGWQLLFHQGTPTDAFPRDAAKNSTDIWLGYDLSMTYPVSRERLFSALTDATVLKRIWRVQQITVDARVGGTTSAVSIDGGQDWSFTITYTKVVPNHTLKWITRFTSFPTKETRVTVQLKDAVNGAEMTIRMENFETTQERDANKQAWQHGLATLAGLLK
jgi:uncharacterized protein YndB with AHSA1/START domain